MSTQKHSAKRLLHYTGYFTDKIQLFQQRTILGTGKPIFSYSNFPTLTLSEQEKIDRERTVSMIPVLTVAYAHILLEIGNY